MGILKKNREEQQAAKYISMLKISVPDPQKASIDNLSGGKPAKGRHCKMDLCGLGYPDSGRADEGGIDVGAKQRYIR